MTVVAQMIILLMEKQSYSGKSNVHLDKLQHLSVTESHLYPWCHLTLESRNEAVETVQVIRGGRRDTLLRDTL